jgi:hypothetical protein
MRQGSGMSFISHSAVIRGVSEVSVAIATVSGFWKKFHMDNQKRKLDPFTPAMRSKGEKARNRQKRIK